MRLDLIEVKDEKIGAAAFASVQMAQEKHEQFEKDQIRLEEIILRGSSSYVLFDELESSNTASEVKVQMDVCQNLKIYESQNLKLCEIQS